MSKHGRIIILGGSGRIGSEILRLLQAELPESEVIGTGRTPEKGSELIRFNPLTDDWKVLPPCDVLINAIGRIREEKGTSLSRIHEGLSELILSHRAQLGNPRIIQISGLGASPENPTEFLRTKGLADAMMLQEPNTTVLRPSVVCTDDTLLVKKISTLIQVSKFTFRKIFCPKGFLATRIQPVMPADVANAVLQTIREPSLHGAYDIGGSTSYTFREIITLMTENADLKVKLLEVPREVIDGFVKYFLSVWFPGLINYDQFQLLFADNVVETPFPFSRPPAGTEDFWRKALLSDEALGMETPPTPQVAT